MKIRLREVVYIVVALVIVALIASVSSNAARRPLLADLASANAALEESQGMTAEATESLAVTRDEIIGLQGRIASLEASASITDDALGNLIEQVEAAGFKVSVSEEGTVTLTPPKPKLIPQKAPAVRSGIRPASFSGVERWRSLVTRYFPGHVDAALSVMRKESGGDPNATNAGSGCAGLFQIHPCHLSAFTAKTGASDLHDPTANIAFAAYMSDGGRDWSSWSVKP